MAKKDRIPKRDFEDLQAALALLSKYAEEMLVAVTESEVLSTNFTSGVRGADLVYKTIEGVVGSSKTAPAWDLLEPLIEKWNPTKEPKTKKATQQAATVAADASAAQAQQKRPPKGGRKS